MTAALSFSHGANDGQKSMGVIAALLLATGRLETFSVPLWAKLGCGAALTLGTALGGWRIVRTVGRRIFHLAPLDGFASQSASTAVILPASYLGAPVSTTQVVASSVVGVGGGRRRWRHVRWGVVRSIALAWLLTLPGCAVLAAITLLVWKAVE
jgi:PiT family inorganic phosphate transporter